MPNVVRFALPTAATVNVPGVGRFIAGILDVDADNIRAVARARYLVQPFRAVELGVFPADSAPPTLPADPGSVTPLPDPYPQYLLPSELAPAMATVAEGDNAFTAAQRAASVAAVQDAIEDGVIEVGGPGGGGDTTVTYDGTPVSDLEILDATAADVPVTPTGSLSATNVQAAFAEIVADLLSVTDRLTALETGTPVTYQLLTESGNTLTTEAGDVLVLA